MSRHVRFFVVPVLSAALALPLASLGGGSLAAQTPDQRAEIDALRDTLGRMTDPAQVLPIVAREQNSHPASDKELGRLRYGWALVRLGELSDSAPPLVDAMLQFYEAGVRRAKWPYAHFGLGATKLALDDIGAIEIRSVHQQAGSGWRWGAAKSFLASVRADTNYITAAVELGLTVMRTPSWVELDPVVQAMSRAANSGRAGNDVWLVLGRLERMVDSNPAAIRSFDTYVALPGADVSLGQLERARTLFALGRPQDGERAYFAGAGNASDSARVQYEKDASWIADSGQMQAIRTASGEQLPAVLGRFWRDRETASGQAAGTRIAEHYRRWDVAERRYRLFPATKRQWDFGQVFRSANTDLDDRGVIYMRHGEPDDRASFIQDGVPPNESWVYHRPTGDLVLHFTQSLTASGWRLIEGLNTLGASPCQVPALLDSRASLDPRYQMLADRARMDSIRIYQAAAHGDRLAANFFAACVPGRMSPVEAQNAVLALGASGVATSYWQSVFIDRERLAARAAIAEGTRTDSDPLRFGSPLHPLLQMYGVGGRRAGEGQLLLVFAVKGEDHPRADTVSGVVGPVYFFRIRVNISDTLGHLVTSVDSVKGYHTAAVLPNGSLLPGLLSIEVPPGVYRAQISISDTGGTRGSVGAIPGIPVPAFAGPVEMSDLVLGLEGQPLFWNRAGSRFPLNPRNAWTTQEAMEVGFELAGAPAGETYRVKIAIADLGADSTAPPKASVEFQNQASGQRELVTQSLALRALRPGRYLLTTTLYVGDKVLQRERRITIAAGR